MNAYGVCNVPATVKRDPSLVSATVEFDVQRSHVRLERQPRGRPPGTDVVGSRIERELAAND